MCIYVCVREKGGEPEYEEARKQWNHEAKFRKRREKSQI